MISDFFETNKDNPLYQVGGEYFITVPLDNGQTLFQKLVQAPAGEVPIVVDPDNWAQMSQKFMRIPDAKQGNQDLRLNADTFKKELLNWGDEAFRMDMPGLLARLAAGEFGLEGNLDSVALGNAFRQTDYYNSTTQTQRDWANGSEAERATTIANQLSSIQANWRIYTGQNLALPETIAELQSDPQFAGWYEQASKLAKGITTQTSMLNRWLQPLALGIENSPWNRSLAQEVKDSKQNDIDIDDKRADVKDMSERYGLDLSSEKLESYSKQLVDNDLSDADLEGLLDKQSQGLYGYKPAGMEWSTYADPYRRAQAELMETALPDHRDEMLQEALQKGTSLSEFKQSIRKRKDWLGTDNAKATIISQLSAAGQKMGFG